jgi:hypothetical protein
MTIPRNLSFLAEGASATGVLAVTNGGTGVTTSTGTGSVVLSISPTITGTLTASGNITTPVISVSNGIVVNNRTIGTTYSIPSGYSATSAGPITISSGVSVTVPTGGKWVVL